MPPEHGISPSPRGGHVGQVVPRVARGVVVASRACPLALTCSTEHIDSGIAQHSPNTWVSSRRVLRFAAFCCISMRRGSPGSRHRGSETVPLLEGELSAAAICVLRWVVLVYALLFRVVLERRSHVKRGCAEHERMSKGCRGALPYQTRTHKYVTQQSPRVRTPR